MGLRIFDKLFGRAREEEHRNYEARGQYDHEEPQETEDLGLLVDHHFVYPPEEEHEKYIGKMLFKITMENNTEYPMGNINVEMGRSKLGSFERPRIPNKLLDPGQSMDVTVPFDPSYKGGKDQFQFEISFFDFNYKVEERITLDSEPLKVLVPKFKGLKKDEDGYRLLTGDLYRWTLETGVMEVPPKEIYNVVVERLEDIGFSGCDEMVNESLFRGIKKFTATDKKGRKWGAQVQVIGKGKESKMLLYTFGERPLQAYNLSVKVLLKLEHREAVLGSLEE
ncbi:MAG: hypothetical protein R6V01_06910 [Thermoplasmatota archaeon]